MEVELGLRIATQPRNHTFATSETDAAIVILGHLPGIRQEDIDISVNEEGTTVTISGRGDRFLSHAVTSGRRLRLSNEVETRPFRKVFRIPNGVVFDQIDAGFDEEGGVLMVLMPKSITRENFPRQVEEEQESIQEIIHPDEEISSRQKDPHEPETSEAGGDGDSKISEQETPLIRETNERIEQTDRGPENQQSTGLNLKDEIEKGEKEPDPPPNPTTESIEALDLDGKPPPIDAPEPNAGEEQEEPIKGADLDVQTSEGIAPKQDLSGKEEGEDNAPEPSVTPEPPRSKHQEGGDGEISPEKPADRTPTVEMAAETDDVVAESSQQVADAANEEERNDDETGSEASSEESRIDGDGKPEGEETGKKERVRRRRRRRAGSGRASSLLPPLPHLVGSAFILSLVALVAHFMRNRRRGL